MEVLIKLNPSEALAAINSGTLAAMIESAHTDEQKLESITRSAKEELQHQAQATPQEAPHVEAPIIPAAQQTPAVQPVPAVPTAAQTYTMEQLAVAATQLVDAGRRTELVGLLNSFGVQALMALPKEQYGAFATQLRTMGAKI